MKLDKKKLMKKVIFGSSLGMIVTALIIIVPCLMILDFFGANITDNYVENNMDYADMYKQTLNKAINNGYGYVPLNRILYFYLENDKLSFYDIYMDNIDKESNKMKTISDVCTLQKYKIYEGCKDLDSSDQIDEEMNIFEDGYDLFKKIDINPYDYGIILKISDKMVDKYSLIAFAALLRNEINVERWLFKNNSNSELSNVKNKVEELYNKISESIDHVREEISIIELNNIINEIFYFGLNDNEIQNVSSLFDDISKDYVDIDIKAKTGSGNIVLVPKNDICYILIYKILFGLKIRRLLEKKVYDIVQEDYTEVGDLIEKIPNTPLYDYYNLYKYIINSFNHSSSRVVPPIFVYSFKSLREMYEELQAL